MKLFFRFGSHPAISWQEVTSVLGGRVQAERFSGDGVVVETDEDPVELQSRLGGTIWVGEVLYDVNAEFSLREQRDELIDDDVCRKIAEEFPEGKLRLGVSVIGSRWRARDVRQMGLAVKRRIAGMRQGSVRMVSSQGGTELGAGEILYNKLLRSGAVLCVVEMGDRVLLVRQRTLQPVDAYTERDRERPRTDMRTGMLPPKLAQILVNLAGIERGGHVYDPFCGMGTVLQEAVLLGYRASGSDLSPEMADATRENLDWLRRREKIEVGEIFAHDAREVIRGEISGVDAVVTESFLGPRFTSLPQKGGVEKLQHDLGSLIEDAFAAWVDLLPVGAPVVVTFPVYLYPDGIVAGISDESVDRIQVGGYDIESLVDDKVLSLVSRERDGRQQDRRRALPIVPFRRANRPTLLYARPDQIVGREILKFRRRAN